VSNHHHHPASELLHHPKLQLLCPLNKKSSLSLPLGSSTLLEIEADCPWFCNLCQKMKSATGWRTMALILASEGARHFEVRESHHEKDISVWGQTEGEG
jgi:hypothetical protein